IEQIVDLMVADLRRRLEDRGVKLELSSDARQLIAEKGFDPIYGARPLRRYIQRELETRVARALITGEVSEGATVRVLVKDRNIAVEITAPSPVS
ncbi:MAG TPA: type VI secretion system ATPase TssH, partial [Candidatus Eisenbacteria bacterium]|nr:type VI secretion system ATPase TssH [Candidatus Eisenbacteria bacterium]